MTEGERVILDLIESGFLRIDDDGSIWRLKMRTSRGPVVDLAQPKRADHEDRRYVGYRSVRARINGREFAASAHRIVLIAKGEPVPDGPARGPIAPEVEDRIVALTKQGVSSANIAEMVGVHIRTVQRVREKRGVSRPWTGAHLLTEDDKRIVAALLDDGASIAEAARTIGFSQTTLHKHFPGRAWTHVQSGQYARLHDNRVRGKRHLIQGNLS